MDTMISNIIKFKPRSTDAETVLEEYVEGAKNLPFLQASFVVWDDDIWDMTGLAKPERANAIPKVNFYKTSSALKVFLKAYVLWAVAENFANQKQIFRYSAPVRNARFLYQAMQNNGVENPCDLTPEILDEALNIIPKTSPNTWEQNVKKVGWLIDVMSLYSMQNTPYEWTAPQQKFCGSQALATSRIIKNNADKLLSEDELDALTEAFNRAQTPAQIICSSIAALLCCAPMRIQEVLELPRNVDVYLDPGDGYQSGLRWFPKKGGMPAIKFVPNAMVPVVKKALKQIKELTSSGHQLALRMMSDGLEAPSRMCKENFPDWPYIHPEKRVRVDEALFVIQKGKFLGKESKKTITFLNYHNISNRLTGTKGVPSIFEELGITLKDGSYPKINTHKPRHYINTIANKSNVPQADIAKWSGRKSLQQNSIYDHETPKELLARIKDKIVKKNARVPRIYKQENFDAATFKETAHTTPFGWCAQSLRQSPCEMFGSCLNCTQLVCVKGATGKLDNIKKDLDRTHILKTKAEGKIATGLRVNERWILQFNSKIERLTQLVEILEDEAVTDGSFIMMAEVPNLEQYSPIQNAVAQHSNQITTSKKQPEK